MYMFFPYIDKIYGPNNVMRLISCKTYMSKEFNLLQLTEMR